MTTPPDRTEPCLQPAVIGLDPIVRVLLNVVDLVAGSSIEFVDKGEHHLKGVTGATFPVAVFQSVGGTVLSGGYRQYGGAGTGSERGRQRR